MKQVCEKNTNFRKTVYILAVIAQGGEGTVTDTPTRHNCCCCFKIPLNLPSERGTPSFLTLRQVTTLSIFLISTREPLVSEPCDL